MRNQRYQLPSINDKVSKNSFDYQSRTKDSLEEFYLQIRNRDLQKNQIKMRKRSERKSLQDQKRKEKELEHYREEIRKLRTEITQQKSKQNDALRQFDDKVSKIFTELKSSSIQRDKKIQNQRAHTQNYSQYYPMPYPNYPPTPQPIVHYHSPHQRNRSEYEQQLMKKFNKKKLKMKAKNTLLSTIYKKRRFNNSLKKFRACVWVVIFSIRLPKYNKKIIEKRKELLKKFQEKNFNYQMLKVQKWMIGQIQQFLKVILANKNFQLQPKQDDTIKMKQQKVLQIKKLLALLIRGISRFQGQDQQIVGFLHLFCKHGCFICNNLMTTQQLALVTVSEIYGYLRMMKNVQKSQIISFLLIKILIYNTLLHPYKINNEQFQQETVKNNLYLIGSVFYTLCMDIQDAFLRQSQLQLGNWQKYQKKFKIKPCQSLCVSGKEWQEGQLISGLYSQAKIDDIYGVNCFRGEKRKLKQVLDGYHGLIREYHRKILQEIDL